jgi:hypothetical protein
MITKRRPKEEGSTLIVSVLVITILVLVVSAYYQSLVPRYRGTYQASSWQEALHGAEAGVDHTIRLLNGWTSSTADPDAYPWTSNGWTTTNATYALNGERTLNAANLPNLGGNNRVRVVRVAVDVYTREEIGTEPTRNPWFRIRATGRADLPGKVVSPDSRDTELRRMKLSAMNGTVPDPHVTRTVEAVMRPRYRFSRAITTVTDLALGNSNNWEVDSFDSADTGKSEPGTSAGGIYPASKPSEIQSNGGIASAEARPSSSPIGALIDGNGAVVKGDVQTFGGDDLDTVVHENVSGSQNMDQTRIKDDFDEEIPALTEPVWTTWTYQGNGPGAYLTGTKANPTRYSITSNLGTFAVTAPPAGTTGYIEIIVTGNLSTGNGGNAGITIPPNVYATIWVRGNVDFGNGEINADNSSSKVASHLSVIGTSTSASATYTASGNAEQVLTFYGPAYAATLSGTVETSGSFVVKSFRINGGGNGGFHYDEALGRAGPIAGWQVASYFEDTRGDL